MEIYLAGPLFTQAERSWNLRLAALLTQAGHSVFLPQTEVQSIPDLDADAIFRCDVDGVRAADAVLAIVDGADPDSGTSFECGLAYAMGIPIVVARTDFRAGGDALPGQKLASINLMLAQAAAVVVERTATTDSIDDLAADLVEALGTLPPASDRPERLRP